MYYLGVDVGTTGVKAVVFNKRGALTASAYEEYPLLFPEPGAAELDTRQVLEAAGRVIRQAAASVDGSIGSVGITSQGEAFACVSTAGAVSGNIMTSSDARPAPLVAPFTSTFGAERLYRITGHTAYPMYTLFKLLWMREHRPQLFHSGDRFLFVQDLLAWWLTGEIGTDYTMAARSMLFDITERQWSADVLAALGIDADRLPRPTPSGETLGRVHAAASEATGLPVGTPVAVCGHDQPVGALGCNAARAGAASYSLGTVECICPGLGERTLDDRLMCANLATYPHVLPALYTTVAFTMTAGSVLRWTRDQLATQETADARAAGEDPYDRIIAAAGGAPSPLVMSPLFGPTGTPWFDPDAVGVLFGLHLTTTRAQVLRAVLEGITFEMRLNLQIMQDAGIAVSDLRAVGGGSRNAAYMQVKADVLRIPITTMQVAEGACMGAALLAAHGAGMLDAPAAAAEWARPGRTFVPDPHLEEPYARRFGIYRELHTSLAGARAQLAALRKEEER